MTIQLTNQQAQALDLTQNCFVEAGAGTGKTTVLVARYCAALRQNPALSVNQILAITFTDKAAEELKTRIATALQSEPDSPHLKTAASALFQSGSVGTIHQFCSRVLRRFSFEAQLPPHFELISGAESHYRRLTRIKQHVSEWIRLQDPRLFQYCQHVSVNQLEDDLSQILAKRLVVNHHHWPIETYPKPTQLLLSMAEHCIQSWVSHMRQTGQIDPDFLLEHTHNVLKNTPAIRHYYQNRLQHIFVDEFQDTDPIQWEIIRFLCDDLDYLAPKKLFLVGDYKQSIYQFRGATPQLFFQVRSEFEIHSHSKVMGTTLNFRTHDGLITPINHLFSHLFADLPAPFLALQTPFPKGPSIQYLEAPAHQQDGIIATWISQIQQEPAYSEWHDFAILVRKKRHAEVLKTQLARFGIPCYIPKSGDLFLSEAIIDLTHLAIALLNPSDSASWYRVLASPIIGLPLTQQYLLASTLNGASLAEAILNPASIQAECLIRHPQEAPLLLSQLSLISQWLSTRGLAPIWDQIDAIIQAQKLWLRYAHTDGSSMAQRFRHFGQFLRQLSERHGFQYLHIIDTLRYHLEHPDQDPGISSDASNAQAIPIYTIHGAKGLEFNNVILANISDRFNLSKRDRVLIHNELGIGLSTPDKPDALRAQISEAIENQVIAEEKRLLYVATTRARHRMLWVGQPETTPPSFQSMILTCPDLLSLIDYQKPTDADLMVPEKLPLNAPQTPQTQSAPTHGPTSYVSHETRLSPAPFVSTQSSPFSAQRSALLTALRHPELSDMECAARVIRALPTAPSLQILAQTIARFRQHDLFARFKNASQQHIAPWLQWVENQVSHTQNLDLLAHDQAGWFGIHFDSPKENLIPGTTQIEIPDLGSITLYYFNP